MDTNLIGAVIAGVATIIAAIIGLAGTLKARSYTTQKSRSHQRIWKSLIAVRTFTAHELPGLMAKPGTIGPNEAQVIYDAYDVLREEKPNISDRLYQQVESLLVERLQSDLNQLLGSIQELNESRHDAEVTVNEGKWLNRINADMNRVQDRLEAGLGEIDKLIRQES